MAMGTIGPLGRNVGFILLECIFVYVCGSFKVPSCAFPWHGRQSHGHGLICFSFHGPPPSIMLVLPCLWQGALLAGAKIHPTEACLAHRSYLRSLSAASFPLSPPQVVPSILTFRFPQTEVSTAECPPSKGFTAAPVMGSLHFIADGIKTQISVRLGQS